MTTDPRIQPVREGWAAVGHGWAVFASSPDAAIEKYQQAERVHREIEAQPVRDNTDAHGPDGKAVDG